MGEGELEVGDLDLVAGALVAGSSTVESWMGAGGDFIEDGLKIWWIAIL